MGLLEFVTESNRIEGILRAPTEDELTATATLINCDELSVEGVRDFVRTVANAPLRDRPGMNVRVGRHLPIPGGPDVQDELHSLLVFIQKNALTPYESHVRYEKLHPFMDGNGRSGRALWAWHMFCNDEDPFALPFLHRFYYQTLAAQQGERSFLGRELTV